MKDQIWMHQCFLLRSSCERKNVRWKRGARRKTPQKCPLISGTQVDHTHTHKHTHAHKHTHTGFRWTNTVSVAFQGARSSWQSWVLMHNTTCRCDTKLYCFFQTTAWTSTHLTSDHRLQSPTLAAHSSCPRVFSNEIPTSFNFFECRHFLKQKKR